MSETHELISALLIWLLMALALSIAWDQWNSLSPMERCQTYNSYDTCFQIINR